MRVGFVGLGNMGKPMAENILRAGYTLLVSDINPLAVKELTEKGAEGVKNLASLAKQTDIVVMSLPNEKIVQNVITGDFGILQGAHKGLCIVDLSSVSPGFSKEMHALATQKDAQYIDAPVSGGVKGAREGTLTLMVGGDSGAIDKCRPIFECIGKKIYEAGEIGAGDAVKMLNNMLLAINMAGVAEAFALGAKMGLDLKKMFEIVSNSSGNSYALQNKVPEFIFTGEFSPGFMIDLQHKDLELVVQTGKQIRFPLLLTNLVQQLYGQAQALGLGKEDISAIIKPLERLGGKRSHCS